MAKAIHIFLFLALASCKSLDDYTKIPSESVWDITTNGISHTTLDILFRVANDPDLRDIELVQFCRFQITGADVRWLEAEFRKTSRRIPKPDLSETLAYFVAYDRQSGAHIATSGSAFRSSEGKWFEIQEPDLNAYSPIERFVDQKEKEERCWGR